VPTVVICRQSSTYNVWLVLTRDLTTVTHIRMRPSVRATASNADTHSVGSDTGTSIPESFNRFNSTTTLSRTPIGKRRNAFVQTYRPRDVLRLLIDRRRRIDPHILTIWRLRSGLAL